MIKPLMIKEKVTNWVQLLLGPILSSNILGLRILTLQQIGLLATLCILHTSQYTTKYWATTKPPTALEHVSGFYGPGAYFAWLLSMLSAVISTRHQPVNQGKVPSADLLSVTAYPLVSAIDMVLRGQLEGRVDDFQIKAAFHIVYLASWCAFICVISGESKFWGSLLYATMIILLNNLIVGTTCSTSHHISMILCSVVSNLIGILFPLLFIFFWVRFLFAPFWLFISPALLLFAVFHGRMAGPPWMPKTFAPGTNSSISELDQAATLVTMFIILLYQWEVWGYISPLIRRMRTFSIFTDSHNNSTPSLA